ncbi:hypothetical protein MRB53_032887 [Persea americana]|uniref:Uncharacterized protein n=1 Tax=Persea americana TaxID=3435 RepID=A0ACC2KT61_PERAE|nr:hypothetical protein MRB53_032887 [Persea americana]
MTASTAAWKSFFSFLQHRDFVGFGESTDWLCLGLGYLQLVSSATVSARQLGGSATVPARQRGNGASLAS